MKWQNEVLQNLQFLEYYKKKPRKQVGFLSFPFHATKVIIGAPN